MHVRFRDSTGGHAVSGVRWYNILKMVEDFIEDIYGVEKFFEKPIEDQIERIDLLKKVHCLVHEKWKFDPTIKEERPQTDIFDLIDKIDEFTLTELEQQLLPLIEATFVWNLNKELGPTTLDYRRFLARQIRNGDIGNLFGYLFEVYVSGLYVYAGWKPKRPRELRTGLGTRKLDWIFQSGGREIGVECGDKRISLQLKENPTYSDINDVIEHARPKFKSWAGKLDRKLVFINLTKPDYHQPLVEHIGGIDWESQNIGYFTNVFNLEPHIDCVVLYWCEKTNLQPSNTDSHEIAYKTRFALAGRVDKRTDLPTIWPLIKVRPMRWLHITKDMERPPTVGRAGPVETAEDYFNEQVVAAHRLVKEKADDAQRWVDLGDVFAEWANHLWASGDKERAYSKFLDACYKYERGTTIDAKPVYYYKWGVSLYNLARMFGIEGKWPEAEGACQDGLKNFNIATQLQPDLFEAYHNWARTLSYLSLVQTNTGRLLLALYSLEEACKKYNIASNGQNNVGIVYYDWGNALASAVYLFNKIDCSEKSIRSVGKACDKYCKSTRITTDFHTYDCWGLVLNLLATVLRDQGRVDHSWQVLRKACSKYAKASEIAPGEAPIYVNWRKALANLATLIYERGENSQDWLVFIEELRKLIHREKWLGLRST